MKLASIFSHLFGFYPHVEQAAVARPARAVGAWSVAEEPVMVFRGIRYHKEHADAEAVPRLRGHGPRVFRGIAYSREDVIRETEALPRSAGVRVFRGIEVKAWMI